MVFVMFTRFTTPIAAILLSSFASISHADENSLYSEAVPYDASFIRFIGFENADTAVFAGKEFHLLENEKQAYLPISSTRLNNVEAGSYVSLIKQPDGSVETIFEGPRNGRSKVFLFLVNASDVPHELRLTDESAVVIANVKAQSADQRGVNPINVSLGVFKSTETEPLAVFDVALKRGQNISFIVDDTGVQLVENRFGLVAK